MRDAEEAGFPSTTFRRLNPREDRVWIRLHGGWREGRIVKWVHETGPHSDRWLIWAFYEMGKPSSSHAWLVYDPETVRRREGPQAPTA